MANSLGLHPRQELEHVRLQDKATMYREKRRGGNIEPLLITRKNGHYSIDLAH